MNGWICLHRQILDSAVFADADLLRLWVWLLARSAHKQTHVAMKTGRGSTMVTLTPGQCIVGRNAAADRLEWKPTTFRDRLSRLESMGMIAKHPATHWTVVSIVNWAEFQSREDDETPTNRQATAYQPPPIRLPTATNNNDNNENKKTSSNDDGVLKSRSKSKKRTYSNEFEQWWGQYPRKVAKPDAAKAFPSALARITSSRDFSYAESLEWLVEQTKRFARQVADSEPGYIKHPGPWLNDDRFNDVNQTSAGPVTAADKRAPTIDELASLPTTPRKAGPQ